MKYELQTIERLISEGFSDDDLRPYLNGERVWHRGEKKWFRVLYYTPDDDLYYCSVLDEEGCSFAVSRESVAFDILNESPSTEIANA